MEVREEPVQTTDNDELNEFQKLLLSGPVMSDEQFEQFSVLRSNRHAKF